MRGKKKKKEGKFWNFAKSRSEIISSFEKTQGSHMLLSVIVLLSIFSFSSACKCRAPTVYASSRATPDAVIVKPTGQPVHTPILVSLPAKIVTVFNGCSRMGQLVNITTSASSAACGVLFPTTSEPWVFFGTYDNATNTFRVNSCDANKPASQLDDDETSFLTQMFNTCTHSCSPSAPFSHCFVQPCAVATCGVDDAVCFDNYCGGCHAYWFTPNNTRVCFGSQARTCQQSGGTVGSSMCCGSVGDFPNTCAIGACSCSPSNSHKVQTCQCPPGKCFNGDQCVSNH